MNIEAEKLEIISWITELKDQQLLRQILRVKQDSEKTNKPSPREFGGGKHFFSYIADDFNEPLDDFKEYME